MSIIHYIIPQKEPDLEILFEQLTEELLDQENEDLIILPKSDEVFHMWLEGLSTRGVDLIFREDGNLEVRNTILSNEADYFISNKLIEHLVRLTGGEVFDENDEKITTFPVFLKEKIQEQMLNDAMMMFTLIDLKQEYTIFGPARAVHLGPKVIRKIKSTAKDEKDAARKLYKFIRRLQYEYPDFDYGEIIQMEDDDGNIVTMKVLTNEDTWLDKYSFFMFDSNEIPILITYDDLLEILPQEWQLMDEYAIMAPKLPSKAWKKLLEEAAKRNKWGDLLH